VARSLPVTWTLIENGGTGVVCSRCGVRQAFELPMSAREFCRRVGAFNVLHEDCPEPPADGTEGTTGRGWLDWRKAKGATDG
jgi:hypothetical protein